MNPNIFFQTSSFNFFKINFWIERATQHAREPPCLCGHSCTIGDKSRATFGTPARRLNITIYPLLYDRWFLELLQLKQF